jgi:hypothetical protein
VRCGGGQSSTASGCRANDGMSRLPGNFLLAKASLGCAVVWDRRRRLERVLPLRRGLTRLVHAAASEAIQTRAMAAAKRHWLDMGR